MDRRVSIHLLKKRERTSKTMPPKTMKARRTRENVSYRLFFLELCCLVGELTQPEGRDGRLLRLLGLLLDLVLGLAAAGLLVLDEFEVRTSLLWCLRLRVGVSYG